MYSDYLFEVVSTKRRSHTISAIKDLILSENIEFTHIAVMGLSGMLVGPQLALLMGKEIIVVRKTQTEHSMYSVEFDDSVEGYIIIDDLIESGATIKNIKKAIEKEKKKVQPMSLKNAELKAVICYHAAWKDNPKRICGVPVFNV